MPIAFDRSVCCDLNETIAREWLITNGQGGYASGTVAGALTRMQHGLLVFSPLDAKTADAHKRYPYILLAKIDEEIVFDQRTYYLGTNEYQDGTLNPSGYAHLETFRLEEGFPVFTYRVGGIDGILLEKRIWMPSGQNTTYIQYRVLRNAPSAHNYSPAGAINRASTDNERSRSYKALRNGYEHYSGYAESMQRMLTLTLLPFSAYRPYDQPQYGNNDWHFQVEVHDRRVRIHSARGQDAAEKGIIDGSAISNDVINRDADVAGCTIRAWDGAQPYHIMAVGHAESEITFIPTGVWYWHFLRRHDQAAGQPAIDDLYLPGVIRTKLWPGEDASSSSTLTIIVTAEELSTQTLSTGQLHLSYKRSVERQRSLSQPRRYFGEGGEAAQPLPVLPFPMDSSNQIEDEEFLCLLFQAGDRFVIQRDLSGSAIGGAINRPPTFYEGKPAPLVVSGYFKGGENTRDALIALPGLLLVTGRHAEAARTLRGLARHFRQGLLPDRLPTPGDVLEERDYGSVDTTLWYFYALDAYLQVTRDYELLDDLYPRLADSISWHREGTYNGIAVDPEDGLLRAQQEGKALTWMNAMSKGVPVTPRSGKPVEVNALWYFALSLLHEWSHILYSRGQLNFIPASYKEQSAQCKRSFNARFWYDAGEYLYDVIDGPKGDDTSLRPNLLLALSLRYPVLNEEHYRPVLDIVTQQLVTPYGLRTLAPNEVGYCGYLKENIEEQQEGLHQGSVWPWLIGPYMEALLRAEGITSSSNGKQTSETIPHQEYVWRRGIQLLDAFRTQLQEGVLGMIGEMFDGDAPHNAGYAIASALSVGEILRVYNLLARISIRQPVALFQFR